MFNFDLSSVRNRLLGFDLFGFDHVIKNNISGGISGMVKAYYTEKENIKTSYNNADSLKKELLISRESVRRLNRRSQKLEKENNNLKKKIVSLKEGYDVKSKDLDQKESQVCLLANNLKALHKEAKKYKDSFIRWRRLSKFLFVQKFYGNVITYPAEKGLATVYVLKNNKIPDKCEKIQIKNGTLVHCIKQDTRYVLIDFVQNGVVRRGYIPSNNIRLSSKPCDMKLVNSANLKKAPVKKNDCEIISGVSAKNDNNIIQKKK